MRKIVFIDDEKQTEYRTIPANVFDAVEHLMDTYSDIYSDINRDKIRKPNCSEIPTGLTTKNDLGVELISRADAIKAMQNKAKKLKNEDTINGLCGAVAILYEMPSVTPQTRKGHWIV